MCVLLHDKILQKRIFMELSIHFQCLLFVKESRARRWEFLFLLNFLLHTLSESIVSLFIAIVPYAENSCYVYFIAVSIDLSRLLSR